MSGLYLVAAIASETTGTLSLKLASDGRGLRWYGLVIAGLPGGLRPVDSGSQGGDGARCRLRDLVGRGSGRHGNRLTAPLRRTADPHHGGRHCVHHGRSAPRRARQRALTTYRRRSRARMSKMVTKDCQRSLAVHVNRGIMRFSFRQCGAGPILCIRFGHDPAHFLRGWTGRAALLRDVAWAERSPGRGHSTSTGAVHAAGDRMAIPERVPRSRLEWLAPRPRGVSPPGHPGCDDTSGRDAGRGVCLGCSAGRVLCQAATPGGPVRRRPGRGR